MSLALTSVAQSIYGQTVYTGTITGGAANALVGQTYEIVGWTNKGNNGTYKVAASTATTLTVVSYFAVVEVAGGSPPTAPTATRIAGVALTLLPYPSGTDFSGNKQTIRGTVAIEAGPAPYLAGGLPVNWSMEALKVVTAVPVEARFTGVNGYNYRWNNATQSLMIFETGTTYAPEVEIANNNGGGVAAQLGIAATYAILAAAGITNTGSTVVTGGVIGSFPTTTINFDGGTATVDNVNAAAGQAAALVAYNAYSALTFTSLGGALDLSTAFSGSNVVTPGNYSFGAATCSLGLVLNGPGLYVFKGSSTISLANAQTISLTNGATAANVVWLVGSSMTLGTTTNMVGTILANTSITLGGGTLNGRAIAGVVTTSGAVTIAAATAINSPGSSVVSIPAGVSGDTIAFAASFNREI
jgi:hypothetical protein